MDTQPSQFASLSTTKKIVFFVVGLSVVVLWIAIYFYYSRSVYRVEEIQIPILESSTDTTVFNFTDEAIDTIDPRFDINNFAPSRDLGSVAPCVSSDIMEFADCEKSQYTQQVLDNVSAVIDLRSSVDGAVHTYLSFKDGDMPIGTIPEFDFTAYGAPSVTYVDSSFILLTFSCFECGEWYYLFDGESWKLFYGLGKDDEILKHLLSADKLFFGQHYPPFTVHISDRYIRVQETDYCCDTVYHDYLNRKRVELLGYYQFLFDRYTHTVVASGFTGARDDVNVSNRSAILAYIQWLQDSDTISPMDELRSWKNYVSFDGVGVPYSDAWQADPYWNSASHKGIHFTARNTSTPQVIDVIMVYDVRLPYNVEYALDFDTIRLIHIMEKSMASYIQDTAKGAVEVSQWIGNTSMQYGFPVNIAFDTPAEEQFWSISKQYCTSSCVLIEPWSTGTLTKHLFTTDPFGVVLREIPVANLQTTCNEGICTIKDPYASFKNSLYPESIFASTESFRYLGTPYIKAEDSNGVVRYYFKINEAYYLAVTFRHTEEQLPYFTREFLDRIKVL